jgi:hypothetical protein
MASDVLLIILVVFFSILISYTLLSILHNNCNVKIIAILNIIMLGGILWVLYLQNDNIAKGIDINIDNKIIQNMSNYLITLSPLIPMVDSEGNPITYSPT